MSAVLDDIESTPEILRQTIARVAERSSELDNAIAGPLVLLGSGSSYCIGISAASDYEAARGTPAQALLGSEYRARPGWTHLAISRTGRTTEVVEAMRRAREGGAHVGLIVGDPGSSAEAEADSVLHLEFAPETGIVQTRFITASLTALRLLVSPDSNLSALPDTVADGLSSFDGAAFSTFRHIVFIGRGPRHGLALSAALTVTETALLAAEGHQTLDYRHGPIALAGEESLVWCFDPPSDSGAAGVVDDIRATGATVYWPDADPIVTLSQAQLFAVRLAEASGVDPDAPRNLTRAIVLPSS